MYFMDFVSVARELSYESAIFYVSPAGLQQREAFPSQPPQKQIRLI